MRHSRNRLHRFFYSFSLLLLAAALLSHLFPVTDVRAQWPPPQGAPVQDPQSIPAQQYPSGDTGQQSPSSIRSPIKQHGEKRAQSQQGVPPSSGYPQGTQQQQVIYPQGAQGGQWGQQQPQTAYPSSSYPGGQQQVPAGVPVQTDPWGQPVQTQGAQWGQQQPQTVYPQGAMPGGQQQMPTGAQGGQWGQQQPQTVYPSSSYPGGQQPMPTGAPVQTDAWGQPIQTQGGQIPQPGAYPPAQPGQPAMLPQPAMPSSLPQGCNVQLSQDRQTVILKDGSGQDRDHISLGEDRVQKIFKSKEGNWSFVVFKVRRVEQYGAFAIDMSSCQAQDHLEILAVPLDAAFEGEDIVLTFSGGKTTRLKLASKVIVEK